MNSYVHTKEKVPGFRETGLPIIAPVGLRRGDEPRFIISRRGYLQPIVERGALSDRSQTEVGQVRAESTAVTIARRGFL